MFEFQKLEVYKKAKAYNKFSRQILTTVPYDKVVNYQLRRAAHSIVLNIAEGSGRFTRLDKRHLFIIARSSLFECVSIIDELNDDQLLEPETFQKYMEDSVTLSKMLFTMIQNLSK